MWNKLVSTTRSTSGNPGFCELGVLGEDIALSTEKELSGGEQVRHFLSGQLSRDLPLRLAGSLDWTQFARR